MMEVKLLDFSGKLVEYWIPVDLLEYLIKIIVEEGLINVASIYRVNKVCYQLAFKHSKIWRLVQAKFAGENVEQYLFVWGLNWGSSNMIDRYFKLKESIINKKLLEFLYNKQYHIISTIENGIIHGDCVKIYNSYRIELKFKYGKLISGTTWYTFGVNGTIAKLVIFYPNFYVEEYNLRGLLTKAISQQCIQYLQSNTKSYDKIFKRDLDPAAFQRYYDPEIKKYIEFLPWVKKSKADG